MNERVRSRAIELGYNAIQAHILSKRFTDPSEVTDFLAATNMKYKIPDINKLKDAKKAAKIIYDALNGEGIIVTNSDYDADGVSGGGLEEVVLKEYFGLPEERHIHIQNEREYGNGFNQHTLDLILDINKKTPVSLIITVDHGSADDVRYHMLPDTIKLVVTDHHLLQDTGAPTRPDAFVNPQRPDDEFSKFISGSTVMYFVLLEVYRLFMQNSQPVLNTDYLESVLPIAAVTVITDQMSMREPINRQLLLKGLTLLNTTTHEPWASLRNRVDIPRRITEKEIGFIIGPLLNAPGRMDAAYVSQKFLSSTNERTSGLAITKMIQLNSDRKSLQNRLLPIATEQVKMYSKKYKNSIVIVLSEGHGVGGIIAGMVGDRFGKPIFVLSLVGDTYVGSGRSIRDNIDIEKAITYTKNNSNGAVIRGGGHKAAGGCSVKKDMLSYFFKSFDDAILEQSGKELEDEEIISDMKVPIANVGMELANIINSLSPYGRGFEAPLLETTVVINKAFKVGPLKNHVTLSISTGDGYKDIKAFYPNAKGKGLNVKQGDTVTIFYNLNIKVSRKKSYPDIIIKNMKI